MTRLAWVKDPANEWLSFETLQLSRIGADGVYVLWYGGPRPGTIRVGKGDIASQLKLHRNDPKILAYSGLGLFVSWAEIPFLLQDGIERYLAEQLSPLIAAKCADVRQIVVNFPWAP
jgi:hypothetical protein